MATTLSKRAALAGKEVTFGRYQQSDNPDDSKEKIQWIVLARVGEKALLLSKYGLDVMRYHSQLKAVTWEESDVRNWLNTNFINTAFTPKEQKAILLTKVENHRIQNWIGADMNGGNDTEDKVFLLSHNDAFQYFAGTFSRMCQPTAYAKSRGAFAYKRILAQKEHCIWWLRLAGRIQTQASCVDYDGYRYNNDVNSASLCIRPALWVDLTVDVLEPSGANSYQTVQNPDHRNKEDAAKWREEEKTSVLIQNVCEKLAKGQDVATIADALEEDEEHVRRIITAVANFASEHAENIFPTIQ